MRKGLLACFDLGRLFRRFDGGSCNGKLVGLGWIRMDADACGDVRCDGRSCADTLYSLYSIPTRLPA